MEEINRNEHIIRNMLTAIEEMDNEQRIRNFIHQIDPSTYSQMGIYARCIKELQRISESDVKGSEYICEVKQTCQFYLKYATGEKFNQVKYQTEFRKEKYRQLNMDLPRDLMDEFDYYLKKNNHTKKSIILQAIEKYINENKNTEKKED